MLQRTAQAEYNQQLRAKVTRGKYVPKSVFNALARRERLIQMGKGHRKLKKRWQIRDYRELVPVINGIK